MISNQINLECIELIFNNLELFRLIMDFRYEMTDTNWNAMDFKWIELKALLDWTGLRKELNIISPSWIKL